MMRAAPIIPAVLFIVAAVLAGGAASAGLHANALIQFMAVLGIGLAIVSRTSYPGGTQRDLLLLLVASVAVALAQTIPLPPGVWTAMPGRQIVIETYRLAGITPGWRPLSLAPDATIGAALAMLPVIAAALIGMRAPRVGLIALFVTLIFLMAASVVLGLSQRTTGTESRFYIYAVTNRGEAVGFFANSNHLATLCALSIPLAAALFIRKRGSTRPNASWLILIAIILFALLGVVFSKSLAGVALAGLALASTYPLARLQRSNSKVRQGFRIGIGVAVILVAVLILWQVWGHVMNDSIVRGEEMGRTTLWQRTAHGIAAFMPFGSGFGSFTTVYPQFENPETVTRVFANHAHNDFLEVIMTGGIPALILMLGFAAWWLRTTMVIWRSSTRDPFSEAATIVTAIIMLHETVDYPLRTAAIATIFGLCCGIMARPRRIVEAEVQAERAGRHVSA